MASAPPTTSTGTSADVLQRDAQNGPAWLLALPFGLGGVFAVGICLLLVRCLIKRRARNGPPQLKNGSRGTRGGTPHQADTTRVQQHALKVSNQVI